jgi:hypothetical protein
LEWQSTPTLDWDWRPRFEKATGVPSAIWSSVEGVDERWASEERMRDASFAVAPLQCEKRIWWSRIP